MRVIYFLWLREVKRYARSRARIFLTLSQPLLFVLVLGFGLRDTFARAGHGSYIDFLAPGIVAMTILFSSIFSGMNILWDRRFGILKETLVAPVPRARILLGRILGGATTATIQGTLVLAVCGAVGFRPANVAALPLALLFMVLIAIVFASLGTAVGSKLRDVDAFQLFTSLMVMPMFFLSGALFPLSNLPAPLALAVRMDPFTYGVDGLRTALSGGPPISSLLNLSVLIAVGVVFVALAVWSFSKIET